MAIMLIGIMLISGLFMIFGTGTSVVSGGVKNSNPVCEKIISQNGINILELHINNNTIYVYDNNFTVIQNFKPTTQAFITPGGFKYLYTYSQTMQNNINLLKVFPTQSSLPMNTSLEGFFYRAITHFYYNGNYFNYSFLGQMNQTSFPIFCNNEVLTDFSIQNVPNIYYYIHTTQVNNKTVINFISNYYNKGFSYKVPYLSGFGNNTNIQNSILFNSISGFYNVSINNYYKNGTITITNTSGYSYSQSFPIGTAISLLLQNGTYSYTFKNTSKNTTYYVNGTFIIAGKNNIINIGNVNSNTNSFFIMFIIINLSLLMFTYLISKNYLNLIPIQALFLILGYILDVAYYQFYSIAIFILFISLYFAIRIMGKIGD